MVALPPPPDPAATKAVREWFAKRPHLELRLSRAGEEQRYFVYENGNLIASHAAPQGQATKAMVEMLTALEAKGHG